MGDHQGAEQEGLVVIQEFLLQGLHGRSLRSPVVSAMGLPPRQVVQGAMATSHLVGRVTHELVQGVGSRCLQGAWGGMGEIRGECQSHRGGGIHLGGMGGRMEDHQGAEQGGLVATQASALGMRTSTLSTLRGRRGAWRTIRLTHRGPTERYHQVQGRGEGSQSQRGGGSHLSGMGGRMGDHQGAEQEGLVVIHESQQMHWTRWDLWCN